MIRTGGLLLPRLVSDFTGRDAEPRRAAAPPIIPISGGPGVSKTSLALHDRITEVGRLPASANPARQ
ncbi:hypothetical protein Acy02nite_16830 [Actinoplanes cyaneus]|uniref:Uncharacterized protein n=1 Tax=Actinoplanes cyaneus TaxID=52696 RepID=A0A919M2T6_9ACTN|nr:hypothetical protein [Actinoplanes cyaneus]MCW2142041.1 hypothetical protein [Actinoplanes cyaneus]GID63802.1 hypothetical protein Acy02nite_16830 [Actinoplanes cyaneus]